MEKPNKIDVSRAATIKETAQVVGVSQRYVQMVLKGDRENDKIVEVAMAITEGKNLLLDEVKKLVPFN